LGSQASGFEAGPGGDGPVNGGPSGPTGERAVLHNAALQLVAAAPDVLADGVPGLVVLDTELPLDGVSSLDVLARDAQGTPVLILFCQPDAALALARMARMAAALQRSRGLLERFYTREGLNLGRTPRFVLLSPRFSDETPCLLDMVGAMDVCAMEYDVVTQPGAAPLLHAKLFHRTRQGRITGGGGEPMELVAAELEPLVGAEELVDVEVPEGLKQLFLEAVRSIRALSADLEASGEGPERSFHVGRLELARLLLDSDGVHLHVGDEDEEHLLQDSAELNASFDVLFEHFFERHGSQL
jgi:hypothetical protein